MSATLRPAPGSLAERAQRTFDFESLLWKFLMHDRKFLTVPEICDLLKRKPDFVERLIEAGELKAHSAGADRMVDRKRVLIESVADYLEKTALYETGSTAWQARVRDRFATWSPKQRQWALEELTRLLAGR